MELLGAVQRGDFPAALELMEGGTDIHVRDAEGRTLLMLAVAHVVPPAKEVTHDETFATARVVVGLLSRGVDLHARDNGGNTALHYACKADSWTVILCDAGADTNLLNDEKKSPHDVIPPGCGKLSDYTPCRLAHLCRCGDREGLSRALDEAKDTPKEQLDSALSAAVDFKHVDIAMLLLDRGADINSRVDGDCPLIRATHGTGDPPMIDALLARGADINALSSRGWPLLAYAINQDVDFVKKCIAAGANVNIVWRKTITPLGLAAERGRDDMVRILLEAGAEVNPAGITEHHPLYVAVKAEKIDIVARLLKAGAAVDAVNTKNEHTALLLACRNGRADIAAVLLDHGANINYVSSRNSPLFTACELGQTEVVRLLISRGVEINKDLGMGGHALVGPSQNGHLEIVNMLLAAGAPANATFGPNHSTALGYAALMGHLEIVQTLVRAGATIDADVQDDKRGNTALCQAASRGHLPVVKYLIEQGANVNKDTVLKGTTTLMAAATKGRTEVLAELLDHGADIHASRHVFHHNPFVIEHQLTPAQGSGTAFIDACEHDHLESVRLLAGRGAHINAYFTIDGVGSVTCLHQAARRGNTALVRLLLELGADRTLRSGNIFTNRFTALDMATQARREETADVLRAYDPTTEIQSLRREVRVLLGLEPPVGKAGAKEKVAMFAGLIEKRKFDEAREVLRGGVDINAIVDARTGSTMLMSVVVRGAQANADAAKAGASHVATVEFLLEHGADPNRADTETYTPLHRAATLGQEAVVRLLLAYGALPTARTMPTGIFSWSQSVADVGSTAAIIKVITTFAAAPTLLILRARLNELRPAETATLTNIATTRVETAAAAPVESAAAAIDPVNGVRVVPALPAAPTEERGIEAVEDNDMVAVGGARDETKMISDVM